MDPCGPVHITVEDGGNREKMAITHADEPGNCPEPSTTPDKIMGGFCAFNFTSEPAACKFCWDRQPDYSAFRESSFGHGILEVSPLFLHLIVVLILSDYKVNLSEVVVLTLLQVKNETHALWTWHRNQDLYESAAGDIIYIVRQPDRCPVGPLR